MSDESDMASEKMMVRWSGITDVGRYRKNNEDAFLALTLDANEVRILGKYGEAGLETHDYIFAVSDGMGGANAGEFASKIAVDKATRLLPKSFKAAAMGLDAGFQDVLAELFEQIHAEVTHLGRCYEELRGMGATLTLCWLQPDRLYFAHVGDSRLYHFPKDGGIVQVSEDHTHIGWKQRQGELNERAARTHPSRNALQQVIGGKSQHLNPHIGVVRYEAGDKFMLCTDGLVEGLWDSGMNRLVRNESLLFPGKNPAERLVAEAVRTDGKDNTTAVVVEVG